MMPIYRVIEPDLPGHGHWFWLPAYVVRILKYVGDSRENNHRVCRCSSLKLSQFGAACLRLVRLFLSCSIIICASASYMYNEDSSSLVGSDIVSLLPDPSRAKLRCDLCLQHQCPPFILWTRKRAVRIEVCCTCHFLRNLFSNEPAV